MRYQLFTGEIGHPLSYLSTHPTEALALLAGAQWIDAQPVLMRSYVRTQLRAHPDDAPAYMSGGAHVTYVLRRSDGAWVADVSRNPSGSSYTRRLQYAQRYPTREAAERDRCIENETVQEL